MSDDNNTTDSDTISESTNDAQHADTDSTDTSSSAHLSAADHCDSTTDLSMLADGLAVQYEKFVEALTELLDNSWAAAYGDSVEDVDPVNIEVSLLRKDDILWVIIADDGPGITREVLQKHYFRTGDRSASTGLLNQKGWGSGNALSWFEFTQSSRGNAFTLRTSAEANSSALKVEGPVTGDLPIWSTNEPWHEDTGLTAATGTCLTIPCAWSEFKTAYGNGASRLSTISQAIRLHLGIVYRDLITAHPDTELTLQWGSRDADTYTTKTVEPIYPTYIDETVESHDFTLTTAEGTFDIEFEHGVLNLNAMVESVEATAPELLTRSRRFLKRYRASQRNQGIDISANGRELELSVFSSIWDKKRHNDYNRYSGRLRIYPRSGVRLPTDNKKTRLDRTSDLWGALVEELNQRTSRIKSRGKTGKLGDATEQSSSLTDQANSNGNNGNNTTTGTSTGDSSGGNGEGSAGGDDLEDAADDESGSSEKGTDDSDWRSHSHSTVVECLADRLRDESATERVYTEKDYAGVSVDVVQKLTNDDVVLWEVKRPGMQPACKHVYHMVMYHDHYTQVEGKAPEKVRLFSDPLSGNGQSDLDTLDGRDAPTGGSYDLEQVNMEWLFKSTNSRRANSDASDATPTADRPVAR